MRRHDVLVRVARASRDELTLDVPVADAFFARDAEAFALLAVAAGGGADLTLRTLTVLRDRRAPAAGYTLTELHRRVGTLPAGERRGAAPDDRSLTANVAANLHAFGLAERVDGPPTRVRARPVAAHGRGAFVVQPSFDVLVPWDAPPARVALLGAVADLEAVDRVCRFHITLASVRRGHDLLHHGAAVLDVLRAGSAHPLPENVEATIAGWVGRTRELHGVRGEVIVAYDDAQRAFVRAAYPSARELVPGAFLVPEDSLRTLKDTAADARVAITRTLVSPSRTFGERDGDEAADELVEQARARLAALAALAALPAAPDAATPAGRRRDAGARAAGRRRRPGRDRGARARAVARAPAAAAVRAARAGRAVRAVRERRRARVEDDAPRGPAPVPPGRDRHRIAGGPRLPRRPHAPTGGVRAARRPPVRAGAARPGGARSDDRRSEVGPHRRRDRGRGRPAPELTRN